MALIIPPLTAFTGAGIVYLVLGLVSFGNVYRVLQYYSVFIKNLFTDNAVMRGDYRTIFSKIIQLPVRRILWIQLLLCSAAINRGILWILDPWAVNGYVTLISRSVIIRFYIVALVISTLQIPVAWQEILKGREQVKTLRRGTRIVSLGYFVLAIALEVMGGVWSNIGAILLIVISVALLSAVPVYGFRLLRALNGASGSISPSAPVETVNRKRESSPQVGVVVANTITTKEREQGIWKSIRPFWCSNKITSSLVAVPKGNSHGNTGTNAEGYDNAMEADDNDDQVNGSDVDRGSDRRVVAAILSQMKKIGGAGVLVVCAQVLQVLVQDESPFLYFLCAIILRICDMLLYAMLSFFVWIPPPIPALHKKQTLPKPRVLTARKSSKSRAKTH